MANIPAQLYRGDSDYLGTISNVDGQILFDSDKKEIFVDDGTTRESYGGGAGDKTYATLAQAQADIANISEKDTVFVKEGTSGSLTQRVDDLEDEVEQINTDLSELNASVTVSTTGTVAQTLAALALAIDYTKITPRAVVSTESGRIYQLTKHTSQLSEYISVMQGTPYDSVWEVYFSPQGTGPNGMSRKDTTSGTYADSSSDTASTYFGATITLYY